MGDYKDEKEAFVAGNPGQSIWEVNAISLVGLSSYGLYLTIQPLLKHSSPVIDFFLAVLPLLLGQTVGSAHPVALNLSLAFICLGARLYHTKIQAPPSALGTLHGRAPATPTKPRTKGQWLEESDSDEEPSHLSVPLVSQGPMRTLLDTSPSSSRPPSPLDLLSPASTTASSASRPSRPSSPTPPSRQTPSPSPSRVSFGSPGSRLSRRHTGQPLSISPNIDAPGETRSKVADTDKKPFLSVYRAHMMVMTILAILAVDFKIFPRAQAKCEDFGTSLMDVGVGSFVFSLGVVASKAHSRRADSHFALKTYISSLIQALRRSIPLLALGFVRVLMVKGTEYPEHVTEYGVHWNFFFTLGLLPFFGALIEPLRRRGWRWSIMAISISIVHQLSLSTTSLESFVLSEKRIGLVGMNKEGIISFPGYLAIFFIGISTGQHILPSITQRAKARVSVTSEARRQAELALVLFGYTVAWWVVVVGMRASGARISRRMANLPYVAWTAAFNTSFLLGYLVLEMKLFLSTVNVDGTKITPGSSLHPPAVPPLLEAINANSLVVFLAANLMTGIVNLSIKTMYASPLVSLSVLFGYSAAVAAIAWALRGYRIKI